jgi:nucleotide-binding universal stress UspA family protein
VALVSRSRSIAGAAKHRFVMSRQTRKAVGEAREFAKRRRGAVRICWDLDNTLVDSGLLLRAGRTLDEAIVEAPPVPNMASFFRLVEETLPDAEQFVLTARPPRMREATQAWLRQHVGDVDWDLCLVPDARAKPRVWKHLAKGAQLVIVDDLSYGHEGEPTVYSDLADWARAAATVYVGQPEIKRIAANEAAVAETAAAVAATLERAQNHSGR